MLELASGSTTVRAALPADWHPDILIPQETPRPRDGASCVDAALDAPLGLPPLEQWAHAGDRVLVLVSDNTRLCASATAVPAVLARLEAAGVRKEDVVVLFANGTHARMRDDEVRALLTPEVADTYVVEQHDARDAAAMVLAGTTCYGTEVRLNRRVEWCTRAVAIGTVVHHYFAGFGGGPKLFVPGIAAYETAVANHRRTLREDGSFDERCADGRVDDNPVALDIRDAARFVPPTFALTVLTDAHGAVTDALAGEMFAVHGESCRRVDARAVVEVDAPYDVVIVSAGGWPKDINLIQSHKSLHHAAAIAREGATIICVAECREGVGNERIRRLFALEREALAREVLEHYEMNAHTVVALRGKASRYDVWMLSALESGDVERLGYHVAGSLGEAVAAARVRHGAGARVAVVPNGSLVVPRVR
jgi:lactate racemase